MGLEKRKNERNNKTERERKRERGVMKGNRTVEVFI